MTDELERLKITIATLEQLLAVHEEVASRQSRRLEAAHAEAVERARELEASRAALVSSELRKTAIVEASLDAVITIGADGIVSEFSRAAEQMFGYSREETIGTELAELIVPKELREAHRAGIAHYLATGEGPVLERRVELEAVRKDGAIFPVEVAIVPVHHDGELFFTGFVRDITEQRKAAERIEHLQRISDTALSSLSLSELLPELLNRLQEVLSPDTIAIMLLNEEGDLELRAGRGLGPSGSGGYTLAVGAGVAGRVARDQVPMALEDIADIEDVHPALVHAGVVSIIAVPLISAGELLGVLHIGSRSKRRFSDDDTDLLMRIGDRIAMAIAHAGWFEREQRIAHTLQMSLLPEQIPSVTGVDVSVRYLPAGDGTKVGGDWYDVIALADGRVGFAMGDVVGRGIKAASVMGQLRHALRAFAFDGAPPDDVLASLDRMISRSETPEMATVLYAIFDPRTATVSYCSAGHPPPLLAAVGTARYLEDGASIPVGIMGDATYACASIELPPGSMLVLYTDGLVERRGEDLADGMSRLAAAVTAENRSAIDAGEDILAAMFPEGEPKDDVAFMVIRYDPAGPDGLHIQSPAEPGRLASFRADLERWLRALELPEHAVFELVVAANEAAANAVEHAYGPGDASFEVEASVLGDQLTIRVRDKGRWRLPRPSRGGRGIHMMEAFADEILLRPRADGTEVVIRRSLTELRR